MNEENVQPQESNVLPKGDNMMPKQVVETNPSKVAPENSRNPNDNPIEKFSNEDVLAIMKDSMLLANELGRLTIANPSSEIVVGKSKMAPAQLWFVVACAINMQYGELTRRTMEAAAANFEKNGVPNGGVPAVELEPGRAEKIAPPISRIITPPGV